MIDLADLDMTMIWPSWFWFGVVVESCQNFKLPSFPFNLSADPDETPDLDFFLSSLLALAYRSRNFTNAFSASSAKIKKIILVIRARILKRSLKWRVQLPASNFNKKWTPSSIFRGFCLDFKLFCLNELLYRYFSRVSRICIFSTHHFQTQDHLWLSGMHYFLYPFCGNVNKIYHIGLETG